MACCNANYGFGIYKCHNDFLKRLTKIGYGKIGAEAMQERQEPLLIERSKILKTNDDVERALALFSKDTIDKVIGLTILSLSCWTYIVQQFLFGKGNRFIKRLYGILP